VFGLPIGCLYLLNGVKLEECGDHIIFLNLFGKKIHMIRNPEYRTNSGNFKATYLRDYRIVRNTVAVGTILTIGYYAYRYFRR
jgi:hypothetical protein